jgi:RNA polymerase sigma-70 factor (ECF subfamily)
MSGRLAQRASIRYDGGIFHKTLSKIAAVALSRGGVPTFIAQVVKSLELASRAKIFMKDPPVIPNRGANPTTSATLLDRARDRDRAAWERLVDLYEPLVLRWCRHAKLGTADAADVTQEVFLAVCGHLADFRGVQTGQSFRGWLRTITRRKICDHLRQAPPDQAPTGGNDAYEELLKVHSAEPSDGPDIELADEVGVLYRSALELIVAEFEELTWKAFWRVVVEGQPAAGVAEDLAMSRNAVYIAKTRVLQRLREEFKDLID